MSDICQKCGVPMEYHDSGEYYNDKTGKMDACRVMVPVMNLRAEPSPTPWKVDERILNPLWTFKDESGSVPWYWRSFAIIANSEENLYRGCKYWFGRDKRSCEVLKLIPTTICKEEIPSPLSTVYSCAGEEALKRCGCIYMIEKEWMNPEFATAMLPIEFKSLQI